ncbi:unnamed protein product [Ectocarpus sp. 12 AP-2014]
MLPLTSAMQPIARYLNGPEARERVEDKEMTPSGGDTLQPIISIFDAQPYRSGSGHEDMPEQFEALIVISRAVPRPTKANEDLSCVINGIPSRASWLSWSMILCSTAHIKRETTLYIAFRGRRFSLAATFQRAPPPRHIRLAWPQSEAFDALLPKPAPTSSWPSSSSHQSAPGVPTGAPFGSSMVICTMFKNEAPYLEEWLQYHRLLGVSKVYMYDNNSSDKSRPTLRKFELSQFVQVLDWPHEGGQTEALNDCLCRFRHTTRWMSFLDVDEFVDPAPGLPIQATGNLRLANVGQLESPPIQFNERAMGARRKLQHGSGPRSVYSTIGTGSTDVDPFRGHKPSSPKRSTSSNQRPEIHLNPAKLLQTREGHITQGGRTRWATVPPALRLRLHVRHTKLHM